ncbi:hypothetical protein ACHAWF_007786 [Thalassiosira exigua]
MIAVLRALLLKRPGFEIYFPIRAASAAAVGTALTPEENLLPIRNGGLAFASWLLQVCLALTGMMMIGFGVIAFRFSILVFNLAFPEILHFPWPMPQGSSRQRRHEKKMKVVFPGSFNPPHWGHLVMIQYLAKRYGQVICCLASNPYKHYEVSSKERAQMLVTMLESINLTENVQVEVVDGDLWTFARQQNTCVFFRGIRTWSVDGPVERLLQVLNWPGALLLGPVWPLRITFLEADPRYQDVSSTLVRKICVKLKQGDKHYFDLANSDDCKRLSRLIPECALNTVIEAYG